MELTQQSWSNITKSIYTAVLIYSIGNVAYGILSPINAMASAGESLSNFASTGSFSSGIGFTDILLFIIKLGILAGGFLYIKGLADFKKILSGANASGIGNVFMGVILTIAAIVLAFIPFIGWILGGIAGLIGFIFTLLGWNTLKGSPTFPAQARKGANALFLTMIFAIIGGILAFIPLIGGIINLIVAVVIFFMTISGWKNIKDADIAQL